MRRAETFRLVFLLDFFSDINQRRRTGCSLSRIHLCSRSITNTKAHAHARAPSTTQLRNFIPAFCMVTDSSSGPEAFRKQPIFPLRASHFSSSPTTGKSDSFLTYFFFSCLDLDSEHASTSSGWSGPIHNVTLHKAEPLKARFRFICIHES